jgi:hypothetical protein
MMFLMQGIAVVRYRIIRQMVRHVPKAVIGNPLSLTASVDSANL